MSIDDDEEEEDNTLFVSVGSCPGCVRKTTAFVCKWYWVPPGSTVMCTLRPSREERGTTNSLSDSSLCPHACRDHLLVRTSLRPPVDSTRLDSWQDFEPVFVPAVGSVIVGSGRGTAWRCGCC